MNSLVHSAASGSIPVADLSALIAKLEAAEGGSREFDAAICIAFQYGGPNSEGAKNVRTDDDWDGDLLFEIGDEECCNPIPAITTSLDAALALAERVYPDGWIDLFISNQIARASMCFEGNRAYHGPRHAVPAIATCIAILRAHASRAVEGA